ncbi:MAG: signal recognition particle subunit SRP19/SEC65 family protein [Sulfolobales archaeon]
MESERRAIVVWPQYLDLALSRRLGRRLSRQYSITKPTVDELIVACKELKIECVVEREAKYSRAWYSGTGGRIIAYCDKGIKKLALLKALSNKVKELRMLSK